MLKRDFQLFESLLLDRIDNYNHLLMLTGQISLRQLRFKNCLSTIGY
jgi:hypothetical protein